MTAAGKEIRTPPSKGFSLLEVLLVVGIIMVLVSSVAMLQFRTAEELLGADAAAAEVVGQMRYARRVSIDQRRTVQLLFVGNNQIQVVRQDDATNTTVMADVTLPTGYTFAIPTGAGETPEGFGNAAAVDLGGGTGGSFLSDGTFVDANNAILNGTIFTMATQTGTSRAVTLTGATGRAKRYSWANGQWNLQ